MILNAYAILDGFLCVLRLVLGMVVGTVAFTAWWRYRRHPDAEGRTALENHSALLFLLGAVLLGVCVASWPLLYLLLQSYVPQWPGVMCVYGVTRVGTDSEGPSRFLPGLLQALQVTKPALVFLSGVWLGLHLLNRRTRTGALTGPVLAVLFGLGLLALADSAAEGAYLVIPKQEEFLAAGCCTGMLDAPDPESRYSARALLGEHYRPWLWAGYYVGNLGMILALSVSTRRGQPPETLLRWTVPLLAGAVLTLVVNGVFLIDVAAPILIHLPSHHCVYDLLPRAPESLVAVVLFVLASFCVGWAAVLRWVAGGSEARRLLPEAVRSLLVPALFGYLGSLATLSVLLAA